MRPWHESMNVHTCSLYGLVYNTRPCFSGLATAASVLHIKGGNYRLNEEMTGCKLRRRGELNTEEKRQQIHSKEEDTEIKRRYNLETTKNILWKGLY